MAKMGYKQGDDESNILVYKQGMCVGELNYCNSGKFAGLWDLDIKVDKEEIRAGFLTDQDAKNFLALVKFPKLKLKYLRYHDYTGYTIELDGAWIGELRHFNDYPYRGFWKALLKYKQKSEEREFPTESSARDYIRDWIQN